ncbi:hypothetical protein EZV62_022958 [Acer yangbiense]|uniref:KIB1-4 beta-propeller domain-containing protein n=1 Tax=Acer yangbiense TaxID=1000413 RepID=A0A5C7H070_9ROSI|nr:hypothetical protein EZV62_022958 [Acer yangbiense]
MAIWDGIDILEKIAMRIKLSEDFVAFRGVGRLWRSAASKENFRFSSSLVTWLMLPPKEEGSDLRSFFSLSKGMSRQINLPDANGNKCYASKGWLMVINKDWSMFLLHPFSSLRIELPHIKTFRNWEPNCEYLESMEILFISKCVLSTSPSLESDYTLVVIYGSTAELAYFRPGFKTWITIDSCRHCYQDVIYYQEQFYVIDFSGRITAIDIKSDDTVVAKKVANLEIELIPEELDLSTDKWSLVKNLGNRALFLGDNSSFSLDISNLKPNCIYFIDDCQEVYFNGKGGKDMGICNLENRSIERIEPYFKGRTNGEEGCPVLSRPSGLLSKAEDGGGLKGLGMARNAPSIIHLFSTDDSLAFVGAMRDACECIKDSLVQYEMGSGQLVNR